MCDDDEKEVFDSLQEYQEYMAELRVQNLMDNAGTVAGDKPQQPPGGRRSKKRGWTISRDKKEKRRII